ncbi:MAG: hypothetical protein ACRC4Y_08495 [Cetobacterium sp.]|uniref:hypothetical protein n=1 Tax=Cetobacterium sp. TaxID=2071632 RepID=UPI003F31768F
MKSFNLFDTTSYDTLDELLIEGNNLFKETFINNSLVIKDNFKQMFISFSGDSLVNLEPPHQNIKIYKKFAHLSTLGKDDDFLKIKYDAYPCSNDLCSCSGDCFNEFKLNYNEHRIERTLCNYRMSKMLWIKNIVDKVNSDTDVKIIQYSKKVASGTYSRNVAFYYKSKNSKNSFIIFFEKRKKGKFYKLHFITAFPVVLRTSLKKYDSEYKKYGIKKEDLFND